MKQPALSWKKRWQIEKICLLEFVRLLKRNCRYICLVIPMYLRSLFVPARALRMRSAYCLARHLDDVLDGDHFVPSTPAEARPACRPERKQACEAGRQACASPEAYATAFLAEVRAGKFHRQTIPSILGDFVFSELGQLTSGRDDPCGEFIALVECMLADHRRGRDLDLWTAAELEAHHQRTFSHCLNVTLVIAGSSARADDLGPLILAQSIIYTLRDLEQDLARGIVNVPREVLAGCWEGGESISFQQLLSFPPVVAWYHQHLQRGCAALPEISALLDTLDQGGRWVVGPLLYNLRRIADRLQAKKVVGGGWLVVGKEQVPCLFQPPTTNHPPPLT